MAGYEQMPLNIKIEKARNELRYGLNVISAKYNLPGCIIDLILDSVRSEECQQRISLIVEQITGVDENNDTENETDNNSDTNDTSK